MSNTGGNIRIGDYVTCLDRQYFGVCGIVIKQYFPTACEEQTMIRCNDGRKFHAPTRLFQKNNHHKKIIKNLTQNH